MEKLIPLRLKRHGTFSIREGWIEKGINYISKDPKCFAKESGTKTFGIGSNMVQSLRYWLTASNLAEFLPSGAHLTELGNLLMQYDSYIENIFSLWFIHINLCLNKIDAPVFNLISNLKYSQFDKEILLSILPGELKAAGFQEVSSLSSLESDISIYLKSYYGEDVGNPENNLNCPLAKLNLLSMDDSNIYHKKNPDINKLDYRAVYYALIRWYDGKFATTKSSSFSFNIEDMLDDIDTPLAILNLTRSSFFYYLDELKKHNYIQLIKTAGLNVVSVNQRRDLSELFRSYYSER